MPGKSSSAAAATAAAAESELPPPPGTWSRRSAAAAAIAAVSEDSEQEEGDDGGSGGGGGGGDGEGEESEPLMKTLARVAASKRTAAATAAAAAAAAARAKGRRKGAIDHSNDPPFIAGYVCLVSYVICCVSSIPDRLWCCAVVVLCWYAVDCPKLRRNRSSISCGHATAPKRNSQPRALWNGAIKTVLIQCRRISICTRPERKRD